MLTFRAVLPGDEASIDLARELFLEYERELDIDLCFQSFEHELASLPGRYTPPSGRLLLAYEGDELAGCGALRGLEPGVCELKRIYVRPAFRARGHGRAISERLLDEGRDIGYTTCRLDTLRKLTTAIALYKDLGFAEIPPYGPDSGLEIVYFERTLAQ
ncbi:MAG: GNAT family N-acetyltransferase [Fimbriimonas ginsengisoli]|uniref:GNAT family N-acetyltransferase n=1 Tax=Fimbriimonas ginsengisoli TaxID=1005039 RepID=A0A931PTS5_FIMGI|nr:GNAT family N-acetyltransferase [Fimbriimonas ginsengisoli]MBI3722229.1 GNAT family N-acetyltransferase [Fimbriimonas ginsengisoli]